MYTALERQRSYRIGLGDQARSLVYTGRTFPDDHPAVFHFTDLETGEEISLSLPQLTALEEANALHYEGLPPLHPGGDDGL